MGKSELCQADVSLLSKVRQVEQIQKYAIQIYSRCSRERCDLKLVASEFGESSFLGVAILVCVADCST